MYFIQLLAAILISAAGVFMLGDPSCTIRNCEHQNSRVIVNCSNSGLHTVPKLCNDDVYEFILSHNNLKTLGNYAFVNCTNLHTLFLDHCIISALEADSFSGLQRLSILNLSNSNLKYIDNDTLRPLRGLKVLDLSFSTQNGLNSFTRVSNFMWALPKHQLTDLNITGISNAKKNACNVEVQRGFWKSIRSSTLTTLRMNKNMIRKFAIDPECLPTLKFLDVSENEMDVNYLFGTDQLRFIEFLDISYQTTDIKYNIEALKQKPKTIVFPSSLVKVLARSAADVGGVTGDKVIQINATGPLNIKVLDLSNNNIKSIMGTIKFLQPAADVTLDLSGNNCQNISVSAFDKLSAKSIKKLYLNKNRLGKMLSTSGGPIPRMLNIEYLDLSENDIITLSPDIFGDITNQKLKTLNLSNNNIRIFSLNMTRVINLRTLDLSRNSLVDFGPSTITELTKAFNRNQNGSSFRLMISGNPIECSCNTMQFLHWTYNNRKNINDLDLTFCRFSESLVPLSKLKSDIFPLLEKHCVSLQWLYTCIGLLTICVVFLTLSVIAYRHRWDIKYAILQFRMRRTLYRELEQEQIDFEYDAFVSHCDPDSPWVYDFLVPHLEEVDHPLRLCLHQRDFIPGVPVEDNILNSISNSRRTVFIISRSFVGSGWCKFEMHMARLDLIDRGIDKIVLVLLEEVPLSEMPRTLVAMLRSHTYIEWPGDESYGHSSSFWSRLRAALV